MTLKQQTGRITGGRLRGRISKDDSILIPGEESVLPNTHSHLIMQEKQQCYEEIIKKTLFVPVFRARAHSLSNLYVVKSEIWVGFI